MADENATQVEYPEVVAQEAKTVGDEAVYANENVHEVDVEANKEPVAAQVTGKPDSAATEVKVHEVAVVTDRVITDTSDPLAVQVPDAGRGDGTLPIFALNAPTVEEVFSKDASDEDDSEAPAPPAPPAPSKTGESQPE